MPPERKNITLGLALIGAAILLALLGFTSGRSPVFEGKRINVWFSQLCTGVFDGTSKLRAAEFKDACRAFPRMGTNAVPYLTGRLTYLRFNTTDKAFLWAIQNPTLRPLTKAMILPVAKRSYAAVALRMMGPAAESAVPALMDAWVHDQPEVKMNCIAALAAILHGQPMADGLSPAEWKLAEMQILSDAARRFPEAARRLGIAIEPAPAHTASSAPGR